MRDSFDITICRKRYIGNFFYITGNSRVPKDPRDKFLLYFQEAPNFLSKEEKEDMRLFRSSVKSWGPFPLPHFRF